jgi:hypothetical protein
MAPSRSFPARRPPKPPPQRLPAIDKFNWKAGERVEAPPRPRPTIIKIAEPRR